MKPRMTAIGLAIPIACLANAAWAQTLTSNLVVGLDPVRTMAFLTTGNNPAVQLAVTPGSNMIFGLTDPLCVGAGCTGTLNYLRITIAPFSQDLDIVGGPGGAAHLAFQNATLLIAGPVPMQNDGSQFVVPAGTPTSFTATMSGNATVGSDNIAIPTQLAASTGTTTAPVLIRIDVARQIMTFNGVFPVNFHAAGTIDNVDVNVDLAGSVQVLGSGISPFADVPPVAVATAPAVATCGQPVTLDGSRSTDANGPQDIVAYRWTTPSGTLIATGPTVSVTLPPGDDVVVLHVVDQLGIEGTARVTVHVNIDTPPTFSTPLPVIQVATCGSVTLTPPVAVSACGSPVTVTSNAPAFFRAGRTVVTWTARTASGLTATATQLVAVSPGDDPACCPPGTHVIVGTSNNDTLNGTSGADCILGLGAQDVINGNGGDDIISGGEGDDRISGGSGNDVINGGNGQDRITGDDGDDALSGGGGDDLIDGGNGNDALNGGGGNDRCTGGAGIDSFVACMIQDTIDLPPLDTFPVCQCRPSKCADCSAQAQACSTTPGCASIVGCVAATPNCNQPNECVSACENNVSQQAITQAGLLTSCLGGCL